MKLTTDGPYPALLAQLVKLSIVPKHVVEAVGKDAFNLKPVGSGPYKFEGWQRGVQVTLTRNDKLLGHQGAVRQRWCSAPCRTRPPGWPICRPARPIWRSRSTPTWPRSSKRRRKAKVLSVLTERVAYLAPEHQKPPFDDPKVRQAVAYADRQGGNRRRHPRRLRQAGAGRC